jgi:uncharacterized protein YjiS (DUF1127 family)
MAWIKTKPWRAIMQFHVSLPTRPATVTSALVASVVRYAGVTWQRLQTWHRRRATVRILQGLSDRTLKDIGVDRSRIEAIVAATPSDRRMRGAPRDFYLS